MPSIHRVRAAFTGFPGGPGVSTFYCLDPATFLPALRAWIQNYAGVLPGNVLVQVEGIGDIIDPVSGLLTGTWTATAPAPVLGAYTGSYAAPVGIVNQWLTGSILDNHRLRGRTFMVPLSSGMFDNDGTVNAANLAAYSARGAEFVLAVASNFVVWHRPRPAGTLNSKGVALPYRAGGYAIVIGSKISDKAAVLTSRRD